MIELNKIYNADCLEKMKDIPDGSVDTLVVDPLYGIDYQSARRTDKNERFDKILNDKKPFTDFIPLLPRILKSTSAVYIFTRWDVQQAFIDEMQDNGMKVKNVLIWDKVAHSMGDLETSYGSRYESILFSSMKDFRFQGNRPTDIIRINRVSADRLVHPNEKPVDIIRRLILDSTPENGVVLDCCCGSGTTAIAAIREKRNWICIEKSEEYFNIAKKRIENELNQPTLF